MNVRLTHPPEFRLDARDGRQAAENARASGGSFELWTTSTPGSAGRTSSTPRAGAACSPPDEEESPASAPATPTGSPTSGAWPRRDDAIYMHCLPADRNVEVDRRGDRRPQSAVYDEAENRLHVQKAVMALTM
jgi:N-acetylornithine carbamoyltransferase